jgi:hypothetical protein
MTTGMTASAADGDEPASAAAANGDGDGDEVAAARAAAAAAARPDKPTADPSLPPRALADEWPGNPHAPLIFRATPGVAQAVGPAGACSVVRGCELLLGGVNDVAAPLSIESELLSGTLHLWVRGLPSSPAACFDGRRRQVCCADCTAAASPRAARRRHPRAAAASPPLPGAALHPIWSPRSNKNSPSNCLPTDVVYAAVPLQAQGGGRCAARRQHARRALPPPRALADRQDCRLAVLPPRRLRGRPAAGSDAAHPGAGEITASRRRVAVGPKRTAAAPPFSLAQRSTAARPPPPLPTTNPRS